MGDSVINDELKIWLRGESIINEGRECNKWWIKKLNEGEGV